MKFIFSFLIIFSSTFVTAQVGVQYILNKKEIQTSVHSFEVFSSVSTFNFLEKYRIMPANKTEVVTTIAQDPLGLFCKLDASMDQKLPFKMRFRLGEYYYNDVMEYGISEMRAATSLTSH